MDLRNLIASALHDRLEEALVLLDENAPDDAYLIIGELFNRIYHALRRDRRFAWLTHDQFDELTAGVREEIYQDFSDRIDGCLHIQDVEHILKRELGDDL